MEKANASLSLVSVLALMGVGVYFKRPVATGVASLVAATGFMLGGRVINDGHDRTARRMHAASFSLIGLASLGYTCFHGYKAFEHGLIPPLIKSVGQAFICAFAIQGVQRSV